jgi:putative ABC transport system permease protein
MKRSLRSWLWRVPLEQEVDEELALHIDMRTRELVERGLDAKTARDIVLSRIGDLGQLKRTCVDLSRKRDREMRLAQWLDERKADVTFAVRQLKASPAFTAVAAITLALGIGANSAMFALADATLLRPLPYPESDRLVMIWGRHPTVPRSGMSPADLKDFSEQSQTLEAVGAVAFGAGGGPLVEAPDGSVQSAERQMVTASFFDVLGVTPLLGRTFRPDDATTAAPAVVLMGEGVWRTRFGSDPSIVGRQVRLNGQPTTVIGVVADNVQLQRVAQIWTLVPELELPRSARLLQTIGRVKAGTSLAAAEADLAVIADRLAQSHPETNKDWSIRVEPLHTGIMGRELQLTSIFLFGVVGFVLLMCCANVANLVLARASVRGRELAVRAAFGAGRSRIVMQLLTESLVLAVLGGALGLAVGGLILKTAPTLVPPGVMPAAARIALDARVVLFCGFAAVTVGILFGLVPAWQVTRVSLVKAFTSESRSATRGGGGLRNLLVAGEVAAAVLLLCGAGLLLRTMLVLGSVDTGYRVDGDTVMTLDFSLPPVAKGTRYSTRDSYTQFYETASAAVRALPNVKSLGWSTGLPWGNTSELGRWKFTIVGDTPIPLDELPSADFLAATPDYFTTLDLPIVDGRNFASSDTAVSSLVCIVSEGFVRRHLSGRNPIGQRVAIEPVVPGGQPPRAREIVGVVKQLRGLLSEPADPVQVYVPLAQYPVSDTYLVAQATDGRAASLVAPIRAAIARIDPNTPVRRDRTLTDLGNLNTAPHRFRAVMAITFAALALALAMVGIFGVLAYTVEQRTREFGIRIALGASAATLLRMVAGSAARVVAIGAAVGLVAAAVLSRTISTFLFGVEPLDPVTFASVAVVLGLTAAMAAAAPAWRATRVDPVEAFRAE